MASPWSTPSVSTQLRQAYCTRAGSGGVTSKGCANSVFEEVGGRHPEGLGELAQGSGVRVRPVTTLYGDYSARAHTGCFG